MILASMLPSIDFDVLEYHLQGPKEYYQAGRIAFLPHNVYTNMPFDVEMLHLAGDGGDGRLVVGRAGGAASGRVLRAGGGDLDRRHTQPRRGSAAPAWIAALVYLSTPWIYRLAAIAYVEGPLCFYHAALIWAAVRGWADEAEVPLRFWGLLGLLAGCAMGCKYHGLDLGGDSVRCFSHWSIASRMRSAAAFGCFVLGWAIVMGPWLAKNVIDTGNPVYPLAGTDLPRP